MCGYPDLEPGRSLELGEHLPSPALAFYDWRLSARDGDGAGDGAGS